MYVFTYLFSSKFDESYRDCGWDDHLFLHKGFLQRLASNMPYQYGKIGYSVVTTSVGLLDMMSSHMIGNLNIVE